MKTRHTLTFSLLLICLLTGKLHATTLLVDPGGGGYSDIKTAILNAVAGDTVLVVAGTYTGNGNKNLDFGGTNLVLLSRDGSAVTVIDGEGSGQGISFHSGENDSSVVEGFTFTNLPLDSPIRITNGSNPVFRACIIMGNHVTSSNGGGAYIADSSPEFITCTVAENTCADNGGGFFVSGGSPTFTRCTVIGNFTGAQGGGFRIVTAATPSITGCTISGNRANEALGGGEGGGLNVVTNSSVTVVRTIIWGNRANNQDEVFVSTNSSAVFGCCDLDTFEVSGPVTYTGNTICIEPHFCRPAYCRSLPWTYGDYSLALNSPCLADNNTCGFRMGAHSQGCDTVNVWLGTVSTSWNDPDNWSVGYLPNENHHVQITQGEVVLDIYTNIDVLTQCPKAAESDTFKIVDPGVLSFQGGCEDPGGKGGITVVSGTTTTTGGENCIPTSLVVEFTEEAETIVDGATYDGGGTISNAGQFICTGSDTSTFGVTMENIGNSEDPSHPLGMDIQSGVVEFSSDLDNDGLVKVAPGAT
ncbi:MAG: hypothetical protein ABIF77_08585, partial [bacterium]